MKKKISAFIIHNNNPERYIYRDKLKKLLSTININLDSISNQNIILKNYSNNILRIYNIKNLTKIVIFDVFHKRNFLFKKNNNIIFKIIFPFFIKFLIILFNKKSKNFKIYKHNVIENVVRNKHISAWKLFLRTNNEYLLIFEDDAICNKDSKERLEIIINNLHSINFKKIYVDLGGGYELNSILPLDKNIGSKFFDVFLESLHTNTACSYLISRPLIKEFIEILKNDKFSSRFPIDHLINYLGYKSNKDIFSGHFSEPIFTHGSFKDKIQSWQS